MSSPDIMLPQPNLNPNNLSSSTFAGAGAGAELNDEAVKLKTYHKAHAELYADNIEIQKLQNLPLEQQKRAVNTLSSGMKNYVTGLGNPRPSDSPGIPMGEIGNLRVLDKNSSASASATLADSEEVNLSEMGLKAQQALNNAYESNSASIDSNETTKNPYVTSLSLNDSEIEILNQILGNADGQMKVMGNNPVASAAGVSSVDAQNGIQGTNPLAEASAVSSVEGKSSFKWFSPSFLVELHLAMNEYVNSLTEAEINNLKVLISQMSAIWEFAQREAELIIQKGQLEANSLIAQGISQIFEGVVALGFVFHDVKAKKNAEKEYKETLDEKIKTYENKWQVEGQRNLDSAALRDGEVKPLKLQPQDQATQDARKDMSNAQIKDLQKDEAKLLDYRQRKSEIINTNVMNASRPMDNIHKAISSFNSAGVNFVEAYTKLQVSQVDAAIAIIRAHQDIMRRGADNTDRNMQSLLEDMRQVWQSLNKIIDENKKAFSAN